MNLNEIRVAVRTQLDLDETDLPDVLLDLYVQEGYDRMIGMEARWPFFEMAWDLFVPSNQGWASVPTNAHMIEQVVGSGGLLYHTDLRHLQNLYGTGTTTGTPFLWAHSGDRLHVQPHSASDTTYRVTGFRAPDDWIAQGASSEVDADTRLHLPIIWYACSLGYAQQEDEVLEATYMNRFRESADIAMRSVMRPWSGAPKILNGARGLFGSGGPRDPALQITPPSPPVPLTHAIGGTP